MVKANSRRVASFCVVCSHNIDNQLNEGQMLTVLPYYGRLRPTVHIRLYTGPNYYWLESVRTPLFTQVRIWITEIFGFGNHTVLAGHSVTHFNRSVLAVTDSLTRAACPLLDNNLSIIATLVGCHAVEKVLVVVWSQQNQRIGVCGQKGMKSSSSSISLSTAQKVVMV